MFAFSGEPLSGVINRSRDITGDIFKLIDQYLESRNLYLLIIVDHLDDDIADYGYSRMCHFVNEDCRRVLVIGNYYRPEGDDERSRSSRLNNLKIDVQIA